MKSIKELPETKGKYVLMFVSNHCPYCRQMEKLMKQIEKDYLDKGIEFYVLNISSNPEIATKYNIMSTPLTYFMNGKEVVGKEMGAVSKRAVELELEELLKAGEFIKKIKKLFGFGKG
ncbi:thioredoxin family protein [Hippea maritima]|uniref:Glutaredoxin n=1 Tax=Hippea maritima (strain ATCC 700847 / DSM 10411 / MH2) TaxID=760142 RepID=F2LUA5_HIPMA|nr:thioredoxin family protein [Hippea maritima]AEA34568.1 glutaredoxin [Hippea maritima DSM 10411]